MRHSKRQIGKLRGSLRADESDGHGYYRQRLEWEMTKAFWHLLDSPQSPLLINALTVQVPNRDPATVKLFMDLWSRKK